MNKKQLTFYAFMLTFGIACGDGSVENSEDTTLTQDGNTTKDGNPHKGNNPHKKDNSHKVDNPHKKDNSHKGDNLLKGNDLLKDLFIDQPKEDFLTNYKENLKPLKGIFNEDKTIINLTNEREEQIMNTLNALEVSVLKPMAEAAAEGNLEPIFNVENLKRLKVYLKANKNYSTYIYSKNKNITINIHNSEYLKKLKPLMVEMLESGFITMSKLFAEIGVLLYLYDVIDLDSDKKIKKDIDFLKNKRLIDITSDIDKYGESSLSDHANIQSALKNIKEQFDELKKSEKLGDKEIEILSNISLNNIRKLTTLQKWVSYKIQSLTDIAEKNNCEIMTTADWLRKLKKNTLHRHQNGNYQSGEKTLTFVRNKQVSVYRMCTVAVITGQSIILKYLDQNNNEQEVKCNKKDMNREEGQILSPTDLKKGDHIRCYVSIGDITCYCPVYCIIDEVCNNQDVFITVNNSRVKLTMLEYVRNFGNNFPKFSENEKIFYRNCVCTLLKQDDDGMCTIQYNDKNGNPIKVTLSPFILFKKLPKFHCSDIVCSNEENCGSGVIVDISTDTTTKEIKYRIEYDNGVIKNNILEKKISPIPNTKFNIYDKVLCYFNNGSILYNGMIKSITTKNEKKTYDIQYNDGEIEEDIEEGQIRPRYMLLP